MAGLQDVDSLLDVSVDHYNAGRFDCAEAVLRKIVSANPDEPDALNLLGLVLQDQGKLSESLAMIERALVAVPDFPEALVNLARVARPLGLWERAHSAATQAISLDPDLPDAYFQLGASLFDLGRPQEAVVPLRKALEIAPEHVDACVFLGTALLRLKDAEAALPYFEKAIALDPVRVDAWINLGTTQLELGRPDEALATQRRAVALDPGNAAALGGLASVLHHASLIAESIATAQRALTIAPARADLWLLQGLNFAVAGRFDDAERCFHHALELVPGWAEAHRQLGLINRSPADAEITQALSKVLDDADATASERIAAGFALGASLEKADEYDAAFAAYARANEIRRQIAAYRGRTVDEDAPARQLAWVRETFSAALFDDLRGIGSSAVELVFIVGMPRSGTSLVEQIAASHPAVFGVGERKDLLPILHQLDGGLSLSSPSAWDRERTGMLAEQHAVRMRAIAGGAELIINKLPDNIQILGQIAVLFPNSRLIYCDRDPRDACLSCFFQNFADGLDWSSDLLTCADKYTQSKQLMDAWRAVLPIPFLEIKYETLVADLEGQSRRLIEFLGLTWDSACLDFHNTDRTVMTASQWQVRQPL
ncbi:MAG: protein O-GlcNAc transferase, partial [Acetobacteraceae bacterium]|nr:protein O-GlcNAc transferase [Acetobacteraceae bacterium]